MKTLERFNIEQGYMRDRDKGKWCRYVEVEQLFKDQQADHAVELDKLKETEKQLAEEREAKWKAEVRAGDLEAKLEHAKEDNEKLTVDIQSLRIRAEHAEADVARLQHRYRTVLDDDSEDEMREQIKDLRAALGAIAKVLASEMTKKEGGGE